MKKIHKLLAIGLFGIFAASCSDDDNNIIPADISNLRAESTPGRIVLRWDTPADASTIEYIQVNYFDHKLKSESKRLASVYADSIDIPDTRAKYGDYNFKVKTVSPSGDFGSELTISCVSEAAQKTWKNPTMYPLTAEMFSSNAPEPSEGAIGNLVDYENTSTSSFFHTRWSNPVPQEPHFMTISFDKEINVAWDFWYSPRPNNNTSNKPTHVKLYGSNSTVGKDEVLNIPENEWFLIDELTKEEDNLPTSGTGEYSSSTYYADKQPFRHFKFEVLATSTGTRFWTMGKFKLFTYEVIDPELEED